jgi:hypothetical protein
MLASSSAVAGEKELEVLLMGDTPCTVEVSVYYGPMDMPPLSEVFSQAALSARFGPFCSPGTAGTLLGGAAPEELVALEEAHRLLAVVTADGLRLYPALQFEEAGGVLPALEPILAMLLPAAAEGWSVLYWLTAPLEPFGGSTAPEVLRGGTAAECAAVVKLAEADARRWRWAGRPPEADAP